MMEPAVMVRAGKSTYDMGLHMTGSLAEMILTVAAPELHHLKKSRIILLFYAP